MKKLSLVTIFTGLMLAATSFAAEQEKVVEQTPPKLYLSVYDISSEVATNLATNEISRSNSSQRLCWFAVNEEGFLESNQVTQVFTTPAKMTFSGNNLSVTPSKDGKTYVITKESSSVDQDKMVYSCWKFDNKDPLGDYSLQVKVNDIEYPALSFKVVK